jgi:hypothetical protein
MSRPTTWWMVAFPLFLLCGSFLPMFQAMPSLLEEPPMKLLVKTMDDYL